MAIAFTKYINIVSGVGGVAVATRELIGRLFTTNPLAPTGSFFEFTSASDVGNYFGLTSVEYYRSLYYFSYISKNITAPQKISIARWTDVDVPPLIYGAKLTTTLTQFQAISNGSFTLQMGADVHVIGGLDFAAATSYSDIASIIQAAIIAFSGVQWTGARVNYDAGRGSFNLVGGDAVVATISVSDSGSGTQIRSLIGWAGLNAIFSDGALAETITQTLDNSANASNNFLSFLFIPALTIDEATEATVWTDGQGVNYQYMLPVNIIDGATYSAALINYSGTAMTASETAGEYPEMLPMANIAATNYDARNSVSSSMFLQSNLTPSVSDTTTSNTLDSLRINYYGVTQNAGQQIAFYQRGYLTGTGTDIIDINIYANEVWLKSSLGSVIMGAFLSLSEIPANNEGQIQLLVVVQSVIDQALTNGTISIGKNLTNTQKLYITQITGDPNAWYQVQNIGYWIDIEIVPYVNNAITEYKAVYTLIYSKNDTIRKVEGSDILI